MNEPKAKIKEELKKFLSEKLVSRVKNYKVKGISESDTKAKLVEPLFEKLGWDLRGEEVIREYPIGLEVKPVDYLFKIDEEAQFLMEVRKINVSLEDKSGIMEQSKANSINWCVFTDGNKIEVYNSDWAGDVKNKKFFEVSLEKLSQEFSGRFDTFFESVWLLSRESMISRELEKEGEREYAKRVILEIFKDEETLKFIGGRARVKKVKVKIVRNVLRELEIKEAFPFPLRPPEELVPKEKEVASKIASAKESPKTVAPTDQEDVMGEIIEHIHDSSVKEAFKTAIDTFRKFGRDVSEEPTKKVVVYKVKNRGFAKLHPYRNYFEISIFNLALRKWLSFDVERETLNRLQDRIDKAKDSYKELRKRR
ncbi:hypothetical protein KAW50_01955 [candidate division WOR-3 bacterium]|nr:hypothetical protein [candidate division WOR-3 bacterium]